MTHRNSADNHTLGPRQRFDLDGKVAWVTGGGGLLGAAVCGALAEYGAHVVVSDIQPNAAERVVADITNAGGSASSSQLDVGDAAAVEKRAQGILMSHGSLDVVVNMAFHYTGRAFNELSVDDWEAAMRVTSTGAFLVGRAAGTVMRAQGGGSIIQFSSMYGVVAPDPTMYPDGVNPNPVEYGVAKAGVLQLVRYQAVQLARSGVRVNAIIPGPFPYPWSQQKDEDFMRRLTAKVPMGRVGDADEIAGAVLFLASPASSFVTGTSIRVDGGWTAW